MKMLSDKSLQILGMAAYDIVQESEYPEVTFSLLQNLISELRGLEADDNFKEQNGLPMKSDHLKGAGLRYRINDLIHPPIVPNNDVSCSEERDVQGNHYSTHGFAIIALPSKDK